MSRGKRRAPAKPSTRRSWPPIVDLARGHVLNELASLGFPPTLRRVHYLLVCDPAATALGYQNNQTCYKQLSDRLTRAREEGRFPELTDLTRQVERQLVFDDEADARNWMGKRFYLDRTHLAPRVIIISEKSGIVPLIRSRFAWLPVTSTVGYNSWTHSTTLRSAFDTALLVGDYDPSGLDINRALKTASGLTVERAALTREQVNAHGLRPTHAKKKDSRNARMAASEGVVMQVEVDALPGHVLLDIIRDALAPHCTVPLDADGWPVAPELDAEEARIRARLRGGAS